MDRSLADAFALRWLRLKRLVGRTPATPTDDQEGQLRYDRDGNVDGKLYLARHRTGATYEWEQLSDKQPLDADLTAIAALADPNADRILFWDDSAGTYAYLTPGTNLSITGTTLDAAAGGSGMTVAEEGVALDTDITTLDFDGSDFNLTESPENEVNVALNYGTGAGQPAEGNHTHAQLHDAVTVADTASIDLTLSGQQISAAAIFGSTATTVAVGNHTHALATGATDVTASAAELNFVDGVTSAIQTQLDGKVNDTGDTITGDLTITAGTANLTVQSNVADAFLVETLAGTDIFAVSGLTGAVDVRNGFVTTLHGPLVVNESGTDSDTRIEGDTDQNLFFVDASTDSIGIGTATPSQWLHLKAGTTARAPLLIPSGTNLTTAVAGGVEFDGAAQYWTNDTTSGRAASDNQHVFRLTANGAALGPAIADYFGANSAFPTVLNAVYELNYYLYFSKQTANTVTFTLTNTASYTNLVAFWTGSVITGIAATGATSGAGVVTTTAAGAALPITGSLSVANHAYWIRALAEVGTAGNIRLRVTSTSGTVTPLRGSYYTARRLPAGNVGTFAA